MESTASRVCVQVIKLGQHAKVFEYCHNSDLSRNFILFYSHSKKLNTLSFHIKVEAETSCKNHQLAGRSSSGTHFLKVANATFQVSIF